MVCIGLGLGPSAEYMPNVPLITRPHPLWTAWVITSGSADDGVATQAGAATQQALRQGAAGAAPTVACIGVLEFNRLHGRGALKKLSNGQIGTYTPVHATSPNARAPSHPTGSPGSPGGSRTHGESSLDQYHTHFILVDEVEEATVEAESTESSLFRGVLERFISDNDVSKDGIQTPKVLFVLGGDQQTLRVVRDALDPNDVSTGTSVPVLVLPDSGGASADIWRAWQRRHSGDDDFSWLPTADRCPAYMQLAPALIRDIVRFGMNTGKNNREQLMFFRISKDMYHHVDGTRTRNDETPAAFRASRVFRC